MEELFVMSAKERKRLKVFLRVNRGELQQKEAAALCHLDYRRVWRLYQRNCRQSHRGLYINAVGDHGTARGRESSQVELGLLFL